VLEAFVNKNIQKILRLSAKVKLSYDQTEDQERMIGEYFINDVYRDCPRYYYI
jgi:hypothetical protein